MEISDHHHNYGNLDQESWGYWPDNGIERWPAQCHHGFRQSPINIRASDVDYTIMNELYFVNYNQSGTIYLKNTGVGIEANGFDRWHPRERPYIYGGGLSGKYILSQFHFHWSYTHDDGSEHTIGSLHYPVEVHFVHTKEGYSKQEITNNPDGIAVVAVFLTLSNDATPLVTLDSGIRKIIEKDDETMIFNYTLGVNLPSNVENFYRYSGSLTTPGCSEAVIWTVMAEPIGITEAQLNTLRQVRIGTRTELPDSNARPVQPINGRRVLYRSSSLNHEKLCSNNQNNDIFHFDLKKNAADSRHYLSEYEHLLLMSSITLSFYFLVKKHY